MKRRKEKKNRGGGRLTGDKRERRNYPLPSS